VEGIPLLHIPGVFKGSKVTSLQFKLFSEIVTKKTALDSVNRQLSTLQKLNLENPDDGEDSGEEAPRSSKPAPVSSASVAASVASAVKGVTREPAPSVADPQDPNELPPDNTTPAAPTSSAPALQNFLEKNRPATTGFKLPPVKPAGKPTTNIS
jgi:hypothetical protein